MNSRRSGKLLIVSSWFATLLYVANIVVGGILNPNYSHMRQFASELGKADAAYPTLFGVVSIVTGVVFFAVSIGLWRTLVIVSGRRVLAGISGVFMALFGVNLVFAGAFPLPSPLHSAFGIALLTFLVPWLIAWALWRAARDRLPIVLQLLATPLIVLTAVLQTGVLGGVDGTNIGLAQRIAAAIFFIWLLLTAQWLKRLPAGQVRAA